MTEDYKNLLRDYLTGKLNIEYSLNQPIFKSVSVYQNNIYTYILDHVSEPVANSYHLIKGKDGNGNELDEQLLYGVDRETGRSFIVILDVLFNPIQFIDEYSSGTNFGYIEQLIIDDDGRFYGVETVNGTRRFIMLNNILVKAKNQTDYKVVLRQSYNVPADIQTGTFYKLIKKPLGNRYLFCISATQDYLHYPLLYELTINVGLANEWKEYKYDSTSNTLIGSWASWDANDNLNLKVVSIFDTIGNPNYLYVLTNEGDDLVIEKQYSLPNPTSNYKEAVILNENTMYYSYCYTDNDGVYNQYICKIGNTLEQIFKSPNTDIAMTGPLISSELYDDGYNAYISFNVPNEDDTIDYYMGIIYNDEVYYNNFGSLTYTTSQNLFATNTFHQFNLYQYYLQLGDTSYVATSIFNNLNYNGSPYSDINALVPSNAVLSDDVGNPIFARNLYNKVVNDNVTISTVEIPNTILNYDLGSIFEIEQQSLLSETNVELAHTNEPINKNIYETVDINFYNTLTMINRNDVDNPISNLNGAIRINQSTSKNKDYYDSQATKVRLNYSDGSHYIVAIDTETQITVSNNIATYDFLIYVPENKNLSNLEIVSYDEKTSYITITGSFTPGKYYNIKQDVWVE